jgi:tRNA (guanine37-N1)-methyltransferase
MTPKSFDIIGNIAILKFKEETPKKEKISSAKEILEKHKSITTVLEKSDKFRGRLRTMKVAYLAGEKTTLARYKENNCLFEFDIEKTYFSPRLSNERKEIAEQVKKGEKILVMFAGVAPFSIVIAKNSQAGEVYSNEINRIASKFAEKNVALNKIKNLKVIQGDIKKVTKKLTEKKMLFDRVVMPRPQLKDTFLEQAFNLVKKKGIINYYGFSKTQEETLNSIQEQVKKFNKKIKITLIKKAGDIGPGKFRWRVDFIVLS